MAARLALRTRRAFVNLGAAVKPWRSPAQGESSLEQPLWKAGDLDFGVLAGPVSAPGFGSNVADVDRRKDVADFLAGPGPGSPLSRPGLGTYAGKRRVKGHAARR